jgi:hypothetical protein
MRNLEGFQLLEEKNSDITRLVVFIKNRNISGHELYERLQNTYHIQMEMAGETYVTGISSVCDTKKDLTDSMTHFAS